MCMYICVHMCVCTFVFICVCECLANMCVVFLSECICVLPCSGAIMISYVHVHVCSYVHVCVRVNICIHTYVPEEINIHMYICTFICSCLHSHKCMCGHMYITMFICACVSYMYVCSHVCTWMCLHSYVLIVFPFVGCPSDSLESGLLCHYWAGSLGFSLPLFLI